MTTGIETKLKENGVELPTIKLSAAEEADIIGQFILERIEETLENMSDNNFKRKKYKR